MNPGMFLDVVTSPSGVAVLAGSVFLGRIVQRLSENKKVFSIDAFTGIYLTVGGIVLAIYTS